MTEKSPATAQNAPEPENAPPRPAPQATPSPKKNGAKLGLALGGGVARGWAHIGAVRRLEELGVKPDIIAGTSVGALVGGFWSAGRLDALEEWALNLSRTRMLSYVDVVLNGSGLMGGKRLEKALLQFLPPTNIENLKEEFVAVTAELATGHEVWLRDGDLADAMQAAYALPGVFPPRAVNGRWLIDGALVNPLPVSACRALGARAVIAIGLHADAFSLGVAERKARFNEDRMKEEVASAKSASASDKRVLRRLFHAGANAPGVGTVMLASFNILMDRITRSRLAGDPPDVLVTPHVGHIALLDFDKAEELISLGRKSVDEMRPQIESAIEYLG
ncbi:patatin-like phospholipase family protein [Hyphococcus sp.]|uniref:patatin-like phospholipase family protein n=1 Tax=Hyphococcus sp. TaxID=2038636 RepID=UPI00208C1E80|nr:MAG: phospholipase [Marinicaulis sp.]